MFLVTHKIRVILPFTFILLLAACGTAPIPPSPPAAVLPTLPTNPLGNLPNDLSNQLGNLATNLPNATDFNAAMQGINALGQLGVAAGQNGQISNPTVLNNFVDAMTQMQNQYALREYQELGTVDMPEGAPEVLNRFA